MSAVLISLLLSFGGAPAIVFDNRPEAGLPPEAVAQSHEKQPEGPNRPPRTSHERTDGTIKAVRIRYFNKESWASEDLARAYVAGFLADRSMGLWGFQIWSQSVGRPEIECVIEFSDAHLEKLRREGKPVRCEGKLVIWHTEACFRDVSGRWGYATPFNHFHGLHPRGDRALHRPDQPDAVRLPVGKWRVEFANGVVEMCSIRADGTAEVVEPGRSSKGTATVEGGSFVIDFVDDRVETWTPVGRRMVVAHRAPEVESPVPGIAERVE